MRRPPFDIARASCGWPFWHFIARMCCGWNLFLTILAHSLGTGCLLEFSRLNNNCVAAETFAALFCAAYASSRRVTSKCALVVALCFGVYCAFYLCANRNEDDLYLVVSGSVLCVCVYMCVSYVLISNCSCAAQCTHCSRINQRAETTDSVHTADIVRRVVCCCCFRQAALCGWTWLRLVIPLKCSARNICPGDECVRLMRERQTITWII